jgi:CxxC-x17-CxxC domain-containing protein
VYVAERKARTYGDEGTKMSDQNLTCSECGGSFVFSQSEQSFYESKGLSGPKRCKPCRQARKAADPDRAGRGGGFGAPRGGPAGRGGGFGRPARAPAPAGVGGGGGWGRMGDRPSSDPRQPRVFDQGRPAPNWGDRGPARPTDRRGPPDGRTGAVRSARPDFRRRDAGPHAPHASPTGSAAPAERARRAVVEVSRDAFRPRNVRAGAEPRVPREARQPEAPHVAEPHPKKKKAERPKFDVTCQECGTAAQVPFKPIEGRDVFCQPCYRARARPAGEETTASTEE